MANWGQRSNDHWSAEHFDKYGFRRADLKKLADKIGLNLDIPLDQIDPLDREVRHDTFTEEDVSLLRAEIANLKEKIKKLTQESPAYLGKYRDDDPLLLAIQIRNSEWSQYDPENDRATRGNQASIKQSLEDRGFTSRQAESIELVACPIKRG